MLVSFGQSCGSKYSSRSGKRISTTSLNSDHQANFTNQTVALMRACALLLFPCFLSSSSSSSSSSSLFSLSSSPSPMPPFLLFHPNVPRSHTVNERLLTVVSAGSQTLTRFALFYDVQAHRSRVNERSSVARSYHHSDIIISHGRQAAESDRRYRGAALQYNMIRRTQ